MDTIDVTPIIDSAKNGQWVLFAGLLLTALVQIFRKVLPLVSKKIPKRVLPWIIFGVGVLAAGGGVLAAGGGWQAAIIAGVTVGVGSLGTYDLLKGPGESLLGPGEKPVEPSTPPVEPPAPPEEKTS